MWLGGTSSGKQKHIIFEIYLYKSWFAVSYDNFLSWVDRKPSLHDKLAMNFMDFMLFSTKNYRKSRLEKDPTIIFSILNRFTGYQHIPDRSDFRVDNRPFIFYDDRAIKNESVYKAQARTKKVYKNS